MMETSMSKRQAKSDKPHLAGKEVASSQKAEDVAFDKEFQRFVYPSPVTGKLTRKQARKIIHDFWRSQGK
jgi:hypothetical protein